MIVECEKCSSRFKLDETLIKEAGSKVRCSVCRNIFMVLPPEEDEIDPAMEETTQLSTPPVFDAEGEEEIDPEVSEIFDQAFEEALKEDIEEEAEVEEVETRIKSTPSLEKRESKGPGSLMIMLIIILVIVLGAIAVYFFLPSFLPDEISGMRPVNMEEVTDTGNRRLDIADLNSYFLPTDKIGQLYVIEGKIINNYPADRSYVIVKGAIEDENRKTVDQKHKTQKHVLSIRLI